MLIEYHGVGAEPGRIWHVIGTYDARGIDLLLGKGSSFVLVLFGDIAEATLAAYAERGVSVEVRAEPVGFDLHSAGYILDGKITRRQAMPVTLSATEIAADGVAEAVLAGIPAGAVVTIDGDPVEHNGGLELTSTMPAAYRIAIEHWPDLPWFATVTAI